MLCLVNPKLEVLPFFFRMCRSEAARCFVPFPLCSPTELDGLRCITLNPPSSHIYTWFEEQQFPPLHELVLDRFYQSLSTELNVDPGAVHLTDAFGRTALDWATALARPSDMTALIRKGSPLNMMDLSGRTAVLHAVDSHNIDALRIVLEAGADPNLRIPEGLFRSSPQFRRSGRDDRAAPQVGC